MVEEGVARTLRPSFIAGEAQRGGPDEFTVRGMLGAEDQTILGVG